MHDSSILHDYLRLDDSAMDIATGIAPRPDDSAMDIATGKLTEPISQHTEELSYTLVSYLKLFNVFQPQPPHSRSFFKRI